MKATSEVLPAWRHARLWTGVAVAVTLGVVLAATVAGWMTHGTAILFTLAQDGLAWCF